ncbi:MAG: glycosyl transferase [Candidatus Melainabacteria bacterium GWF2_37_15]|nr:MAG: glycosyl transferase [Candidatus Melainabacteria bacterium GWF2_37_15]
MHNFCTLFDSNFINYGLAMYESLKAHCKDFHLFIFAFDDKCFEVLNKLKLENTTIISLKEFENEDLLRIKPTRTRQEYCWTCGSSTILHCIEKYNLPECTYLDADIYFYSDPAVLIEEMGDASVLLTEHRYTSKYDRTQSSGKYCVQFITFKNDYNGVKALKWWVNACIDWCFAKRENGRFGDQKYLDDWTQRFEGVHVLKHLGGGVAPWNVQQYELFDNDFKLVFYHFHDVKFNQKKELRPIGVCYRLSREVINRLYIPYLTQLVEISKNLKQIDSSIQPIVKIETGWNIKKVYAKLKIMYIRIFLNGLPD